MQESISETNFPLVRVQQNTLKLNDLNFCQRWQKENVCGRGGGGSGGTGGYIFFQCFIYLSILNIILFHFFVYFGGSTGKHCRVGVGSNL